METANLFENIARLRQHGDATRITNMVNSVRASKGLGGITRVYVRYMLAGLRPMTDEVAEVAAKYYEAQSTIMN